MKNAAIPCRPPVFRIRDTLQQGKRYPYPFFASCTPFSRSFSPFPGNGTSPRKTSSTHPLTRFFHIQEPFCQNFSAYGNGVTAYVFFPAPSETFPDAFAGKASPAHNGPEKTSCRLPAPRLCFVRRHGMRAIAATPAHPVRRRPAAVPGAENIPLPQGSVKDKARRLSATGSHMPSNRHTPSV